MLYTEFTTNLFQILALTDTNGIALVNSMLPRIVEYAELRILREFDFLSTRTSDVGAISTRAIRSVAVPSQFIVLEGAAIITPAGAVPSATGAQRIPMVRTSREFIDMVWPNESQTQAPSQIS